MRSNTRGWSRSRAETPRQCRKMSAEHSVVSKTLLRAFRSVDIDLAKKSRRLFPWAKSVACEAFSPSEKLGLKSPFCSTSDSSARSSSRPRGLPLSNPTTPAAARRALPMTPDWTVSAADIQTREQLSRGGVYARKLTVTMFCRKSSIRWISILHKIR